jgi:hypothetical protein
MDNGHKNRPAKKEKQERQVSDLGKRLRELSDKVIASGTERLSAEQISQLLSDIRTGLV